MDTVCTTRRRCYQVVIIRAGNGAVHLGPAGDIVMAYLLTTGPVVQPLVPRLGCRGVASTTTIDVAPIIPSATTASKSDHSHEKHENTRKEMSSSTPR